MGWYAYLKKKDQGVFGVSVTGWSNERLALQGLEQVFDMETKQM